MACEQLCAQTWQLCALPGVIVCKRVLQWVWFSAAVGLVQTTVQLSSLQTLHEHTKLCCLIKPSSPLLTALWSVLYRERYAAKTRPTQTHKAHSTGSEDTVGSAIRCCSMHEAARCQASACVHACVTTQCSC